MIQVMFRNFAAPSNSATTNYPIGDYTQSGATTNAGLRYNVWPAAGVFKNLVIELDAALAVGTVTVALRIVGVAQALSVTISAGNTTGSDTSNSVIIAAGDILDWAVTVSGAAGITNVRLTAEFESFSAAQSCHTCNIGTNQTCHIGPFMMLANASLAYQHQQYVACAGNVTALYGANTFGNVTGAGNELNIYVNKNGTRQDGTGGTVDTKCSITLVSQNVAVSKSFTLPVSVGDILYLEAVEAGTYPVGWTTIGLQFTAAVDGQSNLSAVAAGTPSGVSVNYGMVNWHGALSWSSSVDSFAFTRKAGITPFSVKALYLNVETDPGAAPNSRTFAVRVGGSASTVSVAVTTGNLTVSTTNSATVAAGTTLGTVQHTPADGPTVSGGSKWTMVIDTNPPVPLPTLPLITTVGVSSFYAGLLTIATNLLQTTLAAGGPTGGVISDYPMIGQDRWYRNSQSGYIYSQPPEALIGNPFFQNEWANPGLPQRAGLVEPLNLMESTLTPSYIPGQTPIFPNPAQRPEIQTTISIIQNPEPEMPRNFVHWPVPPKKRFYLFDYTVIRGQDNFPVRHGVINFPNPPVKPPAAPDIMQRSYELFLMPFFGRDATNLPLVLRQTQPPFWISQSFLSVSATPFNQTDYPNPRGRAPELGFTNQTPSYYTDFDIAFNNPGYPNPFVPKFRVKTWIKEPQLEEVQTDPFRQNEWNNPALFRYPTHTWDNNLLQGTLEPPLLDIPLFQTIDFTPEIYYRPHLVRRGWVSIQPLEPTGEAFPVVRREQWPVPLGRKYIVPHMTTVPPSEELPAGPPFKAEQIWPNPLVKVRLADTWIVPPTTSVVENPEIREYNWPNPQLALTNRVDFSHDTARLITGEYPFSFTEWQVPTRLVIPERITDFPLLTLTVPPGEFPVGSQGPNQWPLFIRSPYRIYVVYQQLVLIYRPTGGRRICLSADATEYELEAAIDTLELRADATDYNIETGGSYCPPGE